MSHRPLPYLAPTLLAQKLDELQLDIDNADRAIERASRDPEARLLKRQHPYLRRFYAQRANAEHERKQYLDELDRRCRVSAPRFVGRWDMLNTGDRYRLLLALKSDWKKELTTR